jgi:enoyl-CoA hydratase/carnithine racemase
MEADFQGVAAASEDVLEGIRSFLEKRKPQFKGK